MTVAFIASVVPSGPLKDQGSLAGGALPTTEKNTFRS